MWKAFSRDTWLAIFDIIEFEESCYWAEYLSYINLSDFRRFNGKRWIDYIIDGKPNKSLLKDIVKAIEFWKCMDIIRDVTIKRLIIDKP